MFLLWPRQLPQCGDWTPASVPWPAEGRSSPTNTPVFLPSPLVLLSFAWFYIFFNTGQGLLSALSWCSACTSVSEGVFLMYPWKELYSMSTSSSAILFSHHQLLIARLQYREPMSPCPFPPARANNFSFPSTPKTWSISLGPEIERVWFSSHSSLSFTLYERAQRRRCCFFACLLAAHEHLAHISNFYFISLNIVF